MSSTTKVTLIVEGQYESALHCSEVSVVSQGEHMLVKLVPVKVPSASNQAANTPPQNTRVASGSRIPSSNAAPRPSSQGVLSPTAYVPRTQRTRLSEEQILQVKGLCPFWVASSVFLEKTVAGEKSTLIKVSAVAKTTSYPTSDVRTEKNLLEECALSLQDVYNNPNVAGVELSGPLEWVEDADLGITWIEVAIIYEKITG